MPILSMRFAVAAAFAAFRSWAVMRGLALALLALVAIVYSLSAELSLMAGARGDVVAQRAADAKAAKLGPRGAKSVVQRYGGQSGCEDQVADGFVHNRRWAPPKWWRPAHLCRPRIQLVAVPPFLGQ